MNPLSPTVIDRLRPRQARPEPDWSTTTLHAIISPQPETLSRAASSRDRRLVPVERSEDRAATQPGRRDRVPGHGPQLRAGVAMAAAAGLLVAGLGTGLHLIDRHPPGPVVVEPAASPPAGPGQIVQTDSGPLTATQSDRLVQACHDPGEQAPVAQVHYARTTNDGSGAPPRLAAVAEDTRGEYRACFTPSYTKTPSTMLSGYGPGVLGPGGDLTPTQQRPLRLIGSYQWGYTRHGGTLHEVHLGTAFAVTPTITRVQVRVHPADQTDQRDGADDGGTWFEGEVEGGFVYIPVYFPELADPDKTGPDLAIDARAYDQSGLLVVTADDSALAHDRHGDSFVWPH